MRKLSVLFLSSLFQPWCKNIKLFSLSFRLDHIIIHVGALSLPESKGLVGVFTFFFFLVVVEIEFILNANYILMWNMTSLAGE